MAEQHVMHDNPATEFTKHFDVGTTESKDESASKVLLTLSGNSTGTVGDKFHGYDKNEKQNRY